MPIIIDQVTADITPPAPPTSGPAETATDDGERTPDPQTLQRELRRHAERAARLSAD